MPDLIDVLMEWLRARGPHPVLQTFALVVIILVLAKVADLVTGVLLRRLVRRWIGPWAESFVAAARRPIFVTVLLLGLMIVTLDISPGERAERIVFGFLQTLLIITWIVFAARLTRLVLETLGRRVPPPAFAQPTTAPLLRNVLIIVLVLVGTYSVLLAWNVNVTGLVASAGILGLALSLAAQDTLGNLFSGVAILTDRPYRIGDYIVLDTGERGQVTHIGLRSTRLITRDDVAVSIPNGIMGKAKIVNESGGPYERYRLRAPLRVAYGSDIDQVSRLLLRIAAEHPQVCPEPEPRVRFRAFGDFAMEFELLTWIEQPAQRGLVLHELNSTIYKEFQQQGIRIPVPQQEVRLQ